MSDSILTIPRSAAVIIESACIWDEDAEDKDGYRYQLRIGGDNYHVSLMFNVANPTYYATILNDMAITLKQIAKDELEKEREVELCRRK